MIFTPEESKQIAEMLGLDVSRFFVSADERYKGEDYYAFPDFSLPEWTGPMLEKVLALLFPYTRIRFSEDGYASVGMGASVEQEFIHDSINRNLYDAWKYLKEASNVRPE